ncbi:hypothetical protein ACK8HH_17220 [Gordonia sp. LUNF6]|uniref:hypothetical protein n=1 Tax=Gordonia sp. LUNF6 TaxID=3388658 RepID=UPI00399C286A
MRHLMWWWQNFTDRLWVRIDIALYRAHRRRCEACRNGDVRDQLADDIGDTK